MRSQKRLICFQHGKYVDKRGVIDITSITEVTAFVRCRPYVSTLTHQNRELRIINPNREWVLSAEDDATAALWAEILLRRLDYLMALDYELLPQHRPVTLELQRDDSDSEGEESSTDARFQVTLRALMLGP